MFQKDTNFMSKRWKGIKTNVGQNSNQTSKKFKKKTSTEGGQLATIIPKVAIIGYDAAKNHWF